MYAYDMYTYDTYVNMYVYIFEIVQCARTNKIGINFIYFRLTWHDLFVSFYVFVSLLALIFFSLILPIGVCVCVCCCDYYGFLFLFSENILSCNGLRHMNEWIVGHYETIHACLYYIHIHVSKQIYNHNFTSKKFVLLFFFVTSLILSFTLFTFVFSEMSTLLSSKLITVYLVG